MDERSKRVERIFEIPIVAAALLVIPVIVIEQSTDDETWTTLAAIANWLIWLLFLAEVVVMLAVVSDRRQWARKHLLELAIVILTPPFLPAALQTLRVFRLLRLLRLIAIVKYTRRVFSLEGLSYGVLIAVATALVGGAAFGYAEGSEVTTWDGIWWAVATMTTVGYGDIYPHTDTGRGIAIVVMIVGIGFLSLLIGSVSERFLATELRQVEEDVGEEIAGVEVDVLTELREITQRLQRLEAHVRDSRAADAAG